MKEIPEFESFQEVAEWFDARHKDGTLQEYFEDEPSRLTVSPDLRERVLDRARSRESRRITLDPEHFAKLSKLAKRKGLSSDELVQQWIEEALEREPIHEEE